MKNFLENCNFCRSKLWQNFTPKININAAVNPHTKGLLGHCILKEPPTIEDGFSHIYIYIPAGYGWGIFLALT
jgi:hypothetical protein